jgi:putative SOS response-associated peptidase YedK
MPAGKQPYCIRMEDGTPFFMGGMWDVWHAREPEALFTFTVLTTFPNEVSATVHERMPLIVQPKDYARWLDRDNAGIADIVAPYPVKGVIAYPVSRSVSDPKNDDARLIEPASG